MVTRGGWEYVGNDGRLYKVRTKPCTGWQPTACLQILENDRELFQTEFIADELGYRPVGEHIHPAFVQVDHQLASYLSSRAGKDIFSSRWRGRPSCWRRGGEGGSGRQGKLVKLVRLAKVVKVVKVVKGEEELEIVKGVAGLRLERGGREI